MCLVCACLPERQPRPSRPAQQRPPLPWACRPRTGRPLRARADCSGPCRARLRPRPSSPRPLHSSPAPPTLPARAQVLDARLSRLFDADALLAVAFRGVGSMPTSSIQVLRQQALQEIHEQQLEQQRRLEALLGCKTQ